MLLPDNRTQQDKSTVENLTTTEFPLDTGHKKDVCKTRWSCCGDKCYHFSRDFKTFQESKTICKSMRASLVKIEDENELNFIRTQMSYFTWIGLSRKGASSSWKWEDNSTSSLQMIRNWREPKDGNCASITKTRISASHCSNSRPFICEKRFSCVTTS
uniref:C-type lectin domain-containing protein n=2 Tax=Suricata suricatta TaxID=37032 RepID=A0A673U3K5_SURSU